MDKEKLQIIQELMEELQDKMQWDESDLNERLGRKKPEVADVKVMKVSGDMPMDEDDMEMDDDSHDMPSMDDEMSPEDELKRRLMKLRGE